MRAEPVSPGRRADTFLGSPEGQPITTAVTEKVPNEPTVVPRTENEITNEPTVASGKRYE